MNEIPHPDEGIDRESDLGKRMKKALQNETKGTAHRYLNSQLDVRTSVPMNQKERLKSTRIRDEG